MATFTIADVDGVGASPLGHIERGLTQFTFDPSFGGHTWGATGLPGYTNVLYGSNLNIGAATGTVTGWRLYAPDGTTVVAEITGVAIPLDHVLNGTTIFDPSFGNVNILWGITPLLQGNDTITGSDFADSLKGWNGDDVINGRGGDDYILGGAGDDTLDGGDGIDYMVGGSGVDVINGGEGNDTLIGNELQDTAFYLPVLDELNGGGGDDLICAQNAWNSSGPGYPYGGGVKADGGEGTDRLYANVSYITADIVLDLRDTSLVQFLPDGSSIVNIEQVHIALGSGDDIVHDGAQTDTIETGAGNDTVYWGGGNNSVVLLGDGDDTFYWTLQPGNFNSPGQLNPGLGFDTLIADFSGYTVAPIGNTDFDRIEYTGTAFNDTFGGTSGNDILRGGAGHDQLWSGDGDDILEGGEGNDQLYGFGTGFDMVSYSQSSARVVVNLATNVVFGGDATGDTINGFEGAIGSDHNDKLIGSNGANQLDGGDGRDVLNGKSGADTLIGGDGNDLLTGWGGGDLLLGGAGVDQMTGDAGSDVLDGGTGDDILSGGSNKDRFVFAPGDGIDTVTDFEDGLDRLDFRAYDFVNRPAALSFAAQVGADVVFSFAGGAQVIVQNFTLAQLDVSDVLV